MSLNAIQSLYGYDCVVRNGMLLINDNGVERELTEEELIAVAEEDVKLTAENEYKALILKVESLIKSHILKPITDYNSKHSTNFESVYNCNVYTGQSSYPHQQFCIDIIQFNALVWDASRQIQIDVANGTITQPTEAEFLALLPIYEGIV